MGVGGSIRKGLVVTVQSVALYLPLLVFAFGTNYFNNSYLTPQVQKAQAAGAAPSSVLILQVVVFGVLALLVSVFMQAGTFGYVRNRIKNGKAGLGDFLLSGAKYFMGMFLLGLILVLVLLTFVAICGAFVFFLKKLGIALAVLIGFAGLYVLSLMFMAPYVLVADEKDVLQSLRDSSAFVRRNLFKMMGIFTVVLLFAIVVGFLIGIVLGAMQIGTLQSSPEAQTIIGNISAVVNVVVGVFLVGAFMALYLSRTGQLKA